MEQEHRLVVHAQVPVRAVALAGARDMDTGGAGEAEHEQGDGVPVGDWLELAFADVVFDVQHQEAPRLEHTPAFGPGFKVKGAVGIAPLQSRRSCQG